MIKGKSDSRRGSFDHSWAEPTPGPSASHESSGIGWARPTNPENSEEIFPIRALTDEPLSITRVKRLTGLLFARPESTFAKSQMVASFDYFHRDAAEDFDFLCVGYYKSKPGEPSVTTVGEQPWSFSQDQFIKYKNELQKKTKWTYSGGSDLILCDEVYFGVERFLEVNSALCLNLDQLVKDGTILSFDTFFQGVLDFAKQYRGVKPAWAKSDKEGVRLIYEAVQKSVLKLLPEVLRKSAEDAFRFAVRDISQ